MRLLHYLGRGREAVLEREAEVARLNEAIADNRQTHAHEMPALRSGTHALLTVRIGPLAADALEIEPPILVAAKVRCDALVSQARNGGTT